VFESDRQFADVNADQARQEQRQMALDLFNVNESNREYGLRREAADMAMEKRRQEEQFSRDILAQPSATGAGAAPSRMSPESLFSPVAPAAPGSPLPAPMTGTVPEPAAPTAAGSIEERLAQAKIRAQAAQQVGDADAFNAATMEAARLDGELRRSGGSTEGMTPTQLMSRERLDIYKESQTRQQQEAAEKKAAEAASAEQKKVLESAQFMVNANPDAFPPASSYVPANLPQKEREAALAQAALRDSANPAIQLQSALESDTFEKFLAKMVSPYKFDPSRDKKEGQYVAKTEQEIAEEIAKIPQSVKDKRKKLWEVAPKAGLGERVKSADSPSTTAPAASDQKKPTKAPTAMETPEAREVRLQLEKARSGASRLTE